MDLLEGALGLIPGRLCALTSLGEFGLLSRRIVLHGLALLHRVLKLLVDLVDTVLDLLTSGLLLDSLPLGFGQGLFQGLDLGRSPYTHNDTMVSIHHLLLPNI